MLEKFQDLSNEDWLSLSQVRDFYRTINGKRVLVKGFNRKGGKGNPNSELGVDQGSPQKPKIDGKPIAGMTAMERWKAIQKNLQDVYSGAFAREQAAKGPSIGELKAQQNASDVQANPGASYEEKQLAQLGVSEARNKAVDKAEKKALKPINAQIKGLNRDDRMVDIYLKNPALLQRMRGRLGQPELARLEGLVAGRLQRATGGPNAPANNALQGLRGQLLGYLKKPGNYRES